VTVASKPFYTVADRILGSQFLQDIAEFFLLFQTMYDGFVDRARAVTRLLSDKRTTFVVVSTLETSPVREAEFFVDALRERKLHLGAVVFNKVLPDYFLGTDVTSAARRLCADAPEVAAEAGLSGGPGAVGDADDVARVLHEVGESFLNFQVVATREAEQRTELAAAADLVAAVPYAEGDITDVAGLLGLGRALWR
jgi:anion-transporting  ArsA/GET3 family ATPase